MMADFTLQIPDNVLGIPPEQPKPTTQQPSSPVQMAAEPGMGQTMPQNVEYDTITVGHGSFQIQRGASKEAIQKAIQSFVHTPDFYAGIDRKTGAGWRAREATGNALKPEDRLASLRNFYPDAIPYGEDNFIFTNPENGRVTLYNPEGFQINDIASVLREVTIGAGAVTVGALGAVGGLIVGAPAGPGGSAVTGTKGAIMGSGIGAAGAATVYDFLAETLGQTVRSENIAERVAIPLIEGAYAAGGEAVGRVAVPALLNATKRMLGGGTAASQAVMDKMQALGITPSAGAVTGGKGVSVMESGLQQTVGGRTAMTQQVETIMQQSQEAVERLAADVGQAKSQQGLGVQIQEAAKGALERFAKEQSDLEGTLSAAIGEDAPFAIDNLMQLRAQFMQTATTAPRFSQRAYGQVMEVLDDVFTDAQANGGAIPYQTFRRVRTFFGEKMSDMGEGVNRGLYKRLYAAMSDDLEAGAAARGYGEMFKDTVAFTRGFKQEYDDFLNKIVDYDAPEKGFRFLMNSRKDGGTWFKKLKDQFTPDEWKDVSSTIIQKMGYKNFGNEADEAFSTATFVSNWGSIADEAKDELFSGMVNGKALRSELDNLVSVFGEMNKSARMRNFSNTAGAAHSIQLMDALGGDLTKLVLGGLAVGGQPGLAALGLAGTVTGKVIAPNLAAKLITNPAFVKWLASGPAVRTGEEIAGHIGSLSAIYVAEPAIADALDAYIEVLNQGHPSQVLNQGNPSK